MAQLETQDSKEVNNVHLNDEGEESFVNSYEVIGTLGEGAFGKVVRVVNTRSANKTNYAMKCMSQARLRRQRQFQKEGRRVIISTALDDVQREIAIMKKIRHPNIVQLKEVIRDEDLDRIYMVVDLVKGGQIMNWHGSEREYRTSANGYFTEDEARVLFRDVVLGIEYLHSLGIVHRDLKPENLLRTAEDDSIHVKIADFGVSYMFQEDDDSSNQNTEKKVKGTKGTFHFQSPQALSSHGAWFDPFAADVWAMGINLHAFVLGSLPWFDSDIEVLSDMIVDEENKYPLTIPESLSPELANLLKGLLSRDPDTRFTLDQIKDDPWINGNGLVPLSSVDRVSPVEPSAEEVAEAFTKFIRFDAAGILVTKAKAWVNRSKMRTQDLEKSPEADEAVAVADAELEAEKTAEIKEVEETPQRVTCCPCSVQ